MDARAHRLLRRAASYPQVERILVNPGIKKKLCDTVQGDRTWLRKIRPFWGHDYHFHMRIGCQPGLARLQGRRKRRQAMTAAASRGLVVYRTAVAPQQEPGCAESRDLMTMANLPRNAAPCSTRRGRRRPRPRPIVAAPSRSLRPNPNLNPNSLRRPGSRQVASPCRPR